MLATASSVAGVTAAPLVVSATPEKFPVAGVTPELHPPTVNLLIKARLLLLRVLALTLGPGR